jgi:hypothetical protein
MIKKNKRVSNKKPPEKEIPPEDIGRLGSFARFQTQQTNLLLPLLPLLLPFSQPCSSQEQGFAKVQRHRWHNHHQQ